MSVNKNYDEKSKAYKSYGIISALSLILSIALIAVGAVGVALSWQLPPLLYISMFTVGVFLILLSLIFLTRRTLTFRVGSLVDTAEINDLRSKIEKYNISNKK